MPGEASKTIAVNIVDDQGYEQDEEFYVDLKPETQGQCEDCGSMRLGAAKTTRVLIIDDDEPGKIRFVTELVTVTDATEDQSVDIAVERVGGGTGVIGCSYSTKDDSAIAGADYEHIQGQVVFQSGQMLANIRVKIKAQGRYEKTELFRLYLTEPTGGATFDEETDGGKEACIMSMFIEPNGEARERIDRIMSGLQLNWDKNRLGAANWKEQFVQAIHVNGGEEDSEASAFDWVLHVLNSPWKLLCAFVPPCDYLDGWACFCCSLGVIGIVTAFIGDMAELLGCVMGVPNEITAITFVALGTSLPDTFASKAAALGDEYADASVGNVTGSNSVNVFLGLGLPWMIGSIYWVSKGKDGLEVEAGNLQINVAVFSSIACATIGLLGVRRMTVGAELGGPAGFKWFTSGFLVFLWLIYVALSSWTVLDNC